MTQDMLSPPRKPPTVGLADYYEEDYIRDLGDQISELTPSQAEYLSRYLSEAHGITSPLPIHRP